MAVVQPLSHDPAVLERWKESDLLPYIRAEYLKFMGSKEADPFVAPSFEREIPFITENNGRMGSRLEIVSYGDLLSSDGNFVVSSAQETGKTTLLKHLAMDMAASVHPGQNSDRRIPIYIKFSSLRAYPSYIENLARQYLPDLPNGFSVSSLLKSGNLCFLFDDVDFAKADKRTALTSFIAANPSCRYILTSSTLFVESSALRPEIVPAVPFTRIRMRRLEDGQLLNLIEKHGTTDPVKADLMLSRVLRDASALNVPLTAVTGTFIIQILVDDPDHTILNQAALIERYVEMLLEKYAPRELLPGTFDFKNKTDLLSFVAERMAINDDYSPEENTLIEWCIGYLKGYGLSFSATDLVRYFVDARIFEKHGEHVSFRLRMFFEFFAAIRMTEEQSFKDHVFSDDNYLHFANEIGFYAAINRKDKFQLERIYNNFLELDRKIFLDRGVEDENAFFESFVVPGKNASEEEILDIQRRIASQEQIMQDRLDVLGDDCGDEEISQAIEKPEIVSDQQRWTAHLWLLSRMIKHMELIPDADKRALLSGILQGWVRFAASSTSIASDLARHRKIVFHGVTYISTLPASLPVGEVARRILLSMPTAAARLASNLLGTEKLREQLEEGLGTDAEPPARQLMRVSVLADIGTPNISGPAAKVESSLRGHTYLQHALARKLYEVAIRFRLPKEEVVNLQTLVSRMFVGLENVGGKKAPARKSNLIGSMSRQRLLLSQATKTRSRKK